jgi:hypothetical protein
MPITGCNCLFSAYKLRFDGHNVRLQKLGKDRGDYRFKDGRDMSRCLFVRSGARQGRLEVTHPKIFVYCELGISRLKLERSSTLFGVAS